MTGMKGPLGSGAFAEPRRSEDERMRITMAERDADPCVELRNVYEGSCAQSWIEYFNKRRVLEERQKAFFTMAEANAAKRQAM